MTQVSLHILFFLSGAAALGYQLVWSKLFTTGLGHEMPAVLAVIAAFMAGMALGAWTLDRFIPRSTRAGFWLAGIELVIGFWAIAVSALAPGLNDAAVQWMGVNPAAPKQWFIAFIFPALFLLPATAGIGATLPAMEKFLASTAHARGSIGSIYAANTFGAVAGTLAAPFLIMLALGLQKSAWLLACCNVVVAIGAAMLARTPAWQPEEPLVTRTAVPLAPGRICLTLFLTGFLGIAYEALGVRVLSQVLENTVYTYAAVLAIFLLGTAAGAAAFHKWWRNQEPRRLLVVLLASTASATLVGVLVLSRADQIYQALRVFGDTRGAVLVAELLTAAGVFAVPTFLMGATFSHLLHLQRDTGKRLGPLVALNTLGAALAPAGVVILVSIAGYKWSLFIVSLAYLAPAVRLPFTRLFFLALPFAIAATQLSLSLLDVPIGHRVVQRREGIMASVTVLEDERQHRTLRVDNRLQMGGTAAADAEYRQTHIPLLLSRSPSNALFLGIGTGISFGAAALYPHIDATGVELVPEIVEVLPAFASHNFLSPSPSNLRVFTADARRFVRASEQNYSVIVADVFHPYRDGAGALYTFEHFTAIRQRLESNGRFCQWLPLHQLDATTLRLIVRTFLRVFPRADAWLLRFNVDVPVVALIGYPSANELTRTRADTTTSLALENELKRLGLNDPLRFFGHALADSEQLQRFAGAGPMNTDDNQLVTFLAPHQSHDRDAKPYQSLLALLASVAERAPRLNATSARDDFNEGLERYIRARNVYLHALIAYAEDRREEAIEGYIESARLSEEFTAGYAQGLSIATTLAKSDPARARDILEKLAAAQPERPVARELLQRLFR